MKIQNKTLIGAFSILAIMLLSSCEQFTNLQKPESISVATNADYNVPLGTISKETSDLFDVSTLKDKIQNSLGTKASIYDYKPADDDTLSYLIHYPVYEVPIDIGSYFEGFNLDTLFNSSDMGFSFDQQISIPDIPEDSKNVTQTQSLDIDTKVKNSMNSTLTMGNCSYTIPELTSGVTLSASNYLLDSKGKNHNSITVSGSVADSIVYRAGSAINIKFTKTDTTPISSDFQILLTAKIFDSATYTPTDGIEDVPITESSKVDVANSGTLVLDISNKNLPKSVTIVLDGEVSGGNSTLSNKIEHKYTVNMSLSNETSIKSISGITAEPSALGLSDITVNQSIDMSSMEGYFEYLIVGTGGVSIKAALPSEWTCSGISLTPNLKFNGIGLSDLSPSNVNGSTELMNQYLDLANKRIEVTDTSSSLEVTGTIAMKFENASIDFGVTAATDPKMTVTVGTSITNITTAVIDLTSDKYSSLKTSYSLPVDGSSGSVAVPAELLQYVKAIDFCSTAGHYKHDKDGVETTTVGNGFGLKCNVINSFPTGNDIPIALTSSFFKFSKSGSLSGSGSTTSSAQTWNDYPNIDLTKYTVSDYIDFSFSMGNSLTLTNLTMGSSYEIAVKDISLIFDWDSIDFDASSANVSGSADMSSFDVSSIFSALPFSDEDKKKVQIETLPVYFFAEGGSDVTDLIGNIIPQGTVDLQYNSESHYLLGSASGTADLTLADPITWPKTSEAITWAQSTDSSASPVKYLLGGNTASFYKDLSEIINSSPTGMKLSYNISLGGTGGSTTIYSSQLDSLSNSSAVNISIDMAAIIKLKLDLTGQIKLDIMNYIDDTWSTNTTKDLLGRDSASSTEEYAKYADSIKSFSMNYKITNTMLSDLPLSLEVDAGDILKETFSFAAGENSVELTSDEIKNVLTSYPFHPTVNAVLGKSDTTSTNPVQLEIKRPTDTTVSKLAATVSVSIKMDADTPITVWGAKE